MKLAMGLLQISTHQSYGNVQGESKPKVSERQVMQIADSISNLVLQFNMLYTYGERLKRLRWCELPESVSTHSIWV